MKQGVGVNTRRKGRGKGGNQFEQDIFYRIKIKNENAMLKIKI